VYLREEERGQSNETAVVRVFFLLYSQPRPDFANTIEKILKIAKADEKGTKKLDARMLAHTHRSG